MTTLYVAASNSSVRDIAFANYRCDGTADEVEIQAAITALGSSRGTLVLLPGTFNLSDMVTASGIDGLTIRGAGATIKNDAANHWGYTYAFAAWSATFARSVVLNIVDCTNVIIEGLTFDGNGTTLLTASPTVGWFAQLAVQSSYTDGNATLVKTKHIRVRDCTFHDMRSYGLVVRLAEDTLIEGCTFLDARWNADNGYSGGAGKQSAMCSVVRSNDTRIISCRFDGGATTSSTVGCTADQLMVSPGNPEAWADGPFQGSVVFSHPLMGAAGSGYPLQTFTAPAAASAVSTYALDFTTAYSNDTWSGDASHDYANSDFFFLCANAGSGTNAQVIPSQNIRVTAVNTGTHVATVTLTTGQATGGAETTQNWAGQTVYWVGIETSRFCQDVTVANCNFQNAHDAGLFLLGVKNYTVSNCKGGANIADTVLDAEWTMHGSFVGNQVGGSAGNGIGIQFLSRHIAIDGNALLPGTGGSGVYVQPWTALGANIVIKGNTFHGTVLSVGFSNSTTTTTSLQDLLIDGNGFWPGQATAVTTLAAEPAYPPYCIGISPNTGHTLAGVIRNVDILNNQFNGGSSNAIQLCGVGSVITIDGNTFRNTGVSAIYDFSNAGTLPCGTLIIDNNTFDNIGVQTIKTWAQLAVEVAPADGPYFGTGNRWRNSDTTWNDTQPQYGVANSPVAATMLPGQKYSVTGSRGANAALASLLTQLAKYGFIVDNST